MTHCENSKSSDDMSFEMSNEEKELLGEVIGHSDTQEGDSDECEMANLIRIRSHDDGIFETEDDEDSDYDFPMPEVEMINPENSSNSRKRKQVINPRDGDISLGIDNSVEFIEIEDDPEHDQSGRGRENGFDGMDSSGFDEKRQNRLPLYLLNPNDYGHDPKKQAQIRRAIITYRHHQEKKTQIIKLTDENQKLRSYIESLKLKLLEASSCGCERNKTMDLDVLDVDIPAVPPRMYIRGNKPVLAAPYNKVSISPSEFVQKESSFTTAAVASIKKEVDSTPSPPVRTVLAVSSNSRHSLPSSVLTRSRAIANNVLVPQTSNNRGMFTRAASASNVIATTIVGPKSSMNGGVVTIKPTGMILNGGMPKLQSAPVRVVTAVTPSRNDVVMSTIKCEPGTQPEQRLRTPLQTVKVTTAPQTSQKNDSPATSAPVSRIIFANKATSASNAVQTASQLVFGAKTTTPQITVVKTNVPATTPQIFTASQMALGSKFRLAVPGRVSVAAGALTGTTQLFRTASGQILRMVTTAPPQVSAKIQAPAPQVTQTQVRMPAAPRTQYIPIRPKPPAPPPGPAIETIEVDQDAIIREMEKREFEEMWRRFGDSDSEEETAVTTATTTVTNNANSGRNRKQTITNRGSTSEDSDVPSSKRILRAGSSEIELNKYADIVFEEA